MVDLALSSMAPTFFSRLPTTSSCTESRRKAHKASKYLFLIHDNVYEMFSSSPSLVFYSLRITRKDYGSHGGFKGFLYTSLSLISLIWTCIKTTWSPGSGFMILFPTQHTVEILFLLPGLRVAPGLFTVLQAATPSTLAWFQRFAFQEELGLGCIHVGLGKLKQQTAPIHCSATESMYGMARRTRQYADDSLADMPSLRARSLEERLRNHPYGSSLVHSTSSACYGRHFMVALEATLRFVLWPMHSKRKRYNIGLFRR